MKIKQVTTYHVPPRWLFLKMETDAGLTGWGEAILEGYAHTVEAAVHDLKDRYIGQNPDHINDIWQVLYRSSFYRGGGVLMSAIAGLDQALWDIKGKKLGVPVYEMLGGRVRDRIQTYSWVGGDRPAELIQNIAARVADGFNVFKLNGCEELAIIDSNRMVDAAVAKIAEVRHHFGHKIDFALDFHGRVAMPMAAVLIKELEPFHPLFIEEPVLPEQAEYYPKLAAKTSIPLAAGERMYSRYEFKKVMDRGGIAIIQPDLAHAGGITECFKIAAMAEAYDVALAPHCPLGPIALAACLQLDFVAWNAFIQEQSLGIHYNQEFELLDYIQNKEDYALDGGYMQPPCLPGLGVEIDEEIVLERSKNGKAWKNPLWRHKDGSVAEW